jgi:hypothetical protein
LGRRHLPDLVAEHVEEAAHLRRIGFVAGERGPRGCRVLSRHTSSERPVASSGRFQPAVTGIAGAIPTRRTPPCNCDPVWFKAALVSFGSNLPGPPVCR